MCDPSDGSDYAQSFPHEVQSDWNILSLDHCRLQNLINVTIKDAGRRKNGESKYWRLSVDEKLSHFSSFETQILNSEEYDDDIL